MNKHFLLLILTILLGIQTQAQKKLTWEDFADVNFEPVYSEEYEIHFLTPKFGEDLKAYEGQKVSITGYFLDISGEGDIYLVSENPMAECFFCGAAGPETIVEARFIEKPIFKTDQIVTVTGTLQLNANNVNSLNYILKESTGVLEK
ncbi:hypothetical protein [Pricia sp.]|uniref:hypothetical protein n=1 Tax=Pricia sp. TaxID=2268138 RepID=UPI0035942E46